MYKTLDALIIKAINEKTHANFTTIQFGEVGKESSRIAKETGRDAFRVVDGRLQALRKRGLIKFEAGAWRIV